MCTGRERRGRGDLRDRQPGPEQDRDRVLDGERVVPGRRAVDGNTGTRWSSAFSDPQWLEVDLGSSPRPSARSRCNWETAYATAFQIQTSADGTNWTTIYSTTTGTGGTQTLNVSGTGRYIRMYGTARATQYGYSLWEFQVCSAGVPARPDALRAGPARRRDLPGPGDKSIGAGTSEG